MSEVKRFIGLVLALTVMGGTSALAKPSKPSGLALSGPQVRASLGASPNTAAYLTITNASDKPDTLLSAACDCAGMVMIHRSEMKNGMSTMADADAVVVPPRGQAVLSPGGLHLMVMGLKHPLKAGGTQRFTLTFAHAGQIQADFKIVDRVEAASAMPPAMAEMPGMAH
jgi:copper(I)-binding protein